MILSDVVSDSEAIVTTSRPQPQGHLCMQEITSGLHHIKKYMKLYHSLLLLHWRTLVTNIYIRVDKDSLITGKDLSPWLSGLICFLSHITCWALLAYYLRWPGFKCRSWHEFSVGWTNGRYAMRLIFQTGTVCLCPLKTVTGAASEVTTLRRDRNVHIIIIIID